MSIPWRGARGSSVALWILTAVALIFLLRAASALLIPIAFAVLAAYVLEPVVSWLAGLGVRRFLGAGLLMLLLLGLCGAGGYALRDEAMQAVRAVPGVAEQVREFVTSISGAAPSATPSSNDPLQLPPGVTGVIQGTVGSLLTFVGNLTVVYFLCFFLLISGTRVKTRLLDVAGSDAERRRRLATIIADVNTQIERFLVVRLVTAAVVALLTWAALAWLGVHNAVVWGIAAGVFNSIPYFGPIIVSGGLFLVGLVQDGGTAQAFRMAGAALVITTLEGWLLTPPLMGKAENMNALAVFLGLLFWTWIWGAWGTILAVPMLVIVKAVADHTPSLKPLGRLMAP
jgi:predicted PurR-regulated permease PerM